MNCEALQTFRQEVHKLLTKAKDAAFELMDAVMTTRQLGGFPAQQASSLAEFSLSPMFRRQYPSTYEAIEDCRFGRIHVYGEFRQLTVVVVAPASMVKNFN